MGTSRKTNWVNICLAHALGQLIFPLFAFVLLYSVFLPGTHDISNAYHRYEGLPQLPRVHRGPLVDYIVPNAFILFGSTAVGAASHLCATYGIQKCKTSQTAILKSGDILFGFIAQLMSSNDAITLTTAVGAVLIICCIYSGLSHAPEEPTDIEPKHRDPAEYSTLLTHYDQTEHVRLLGSPLGTASYGSIGLQNGSVLEYPRLTVEDEKSAKEEEREEEQEGKVEKESSGVAKSILGNCCSMDESSRKEEDDEQEEEVGEEVSLLPSLRDTSSNV